MTELQTCEHELSGLYEQRLNGEYHPVIDIAIAIRQEEFKHLRKLQPTL